VTEDHHRYLSNKEEREEGGTPYVIGDIKLGLVMHLKQKFGPSWIEAEEIRIAEMYLHIINLVMDIYIIDVDIYALRAGLRLLDIPNLVLLGRGSGTGRHLPIFSFLIRHGSRFLHHNFVCALLNDLFGVQSRGKYIKNDLTVQRLTNV